MLMQSQESKLTTDVPTRLNYHRTSSLFISALNIAKIRGTDRVNGNHSQPLDNEDTVPTYPI